MLEGRRSIREYNPNEVSDTVLNRVLEAATWAPSAHNAQPWRFVVVRGTDTKLKVARAMADQWRKDLAKDRVSEKDSGNLVNVSIDRFSRAPVIIVPCLTMKEMHLYDDSRRRKVEYMMGVQSVAAAIENMLLAAHTLGLGSCWFCAPLFCPSTVKSVLGTPSDYQPQALITLGYPACQPQPPPRKPLKEIVRPSFSSE